MRPKKSWKVSRISGECLFDSKVQDSLASRTSGYTTKTLIFNENSIYPHISSACFASKSLFMSFEEHFNDTKRTKHTSYVVENNNSGLICDKISYKNGLFVGYHNQTIGFLEESGKVIEVKEIIS